MFEPPDSFFVDLSVDVLEPLESDEVEDEEDDSLEDLALSFSFAVERSPSLAALFEALRLSVL